MWEFSVGLYMINIWPDSLLYAAIYGAVESASTAVFGPIIGTWVDKLTYVKVIPSLIASTSILSAVKLCNTFAICYCHINSYLGTTYRVIFGLIIFFLCTVMVN